MSMEATALELDITEDEATGYATDDVYFATRIEQGGREMFSIDLSIPQLVATIGRPDPVNPIEGNRRIDPTRARAFAQYVRGRHNWVCPTLILRAPSGEFHWEGRLSPQGGTQFGMLSIPRLSRNLLYILDGQHRILGFHMLWEDLQKEITTAKQRAARSRNDGDKDLANTLQSRARQLQKERDELAHQRVQVQIVIVDDPREFKQVFFDIADHAKGISGSVKARFDTTRVANRALDTVLAHPLLEGRVEMESDRITGPYLLGAKHVTDIIRALQVGSTGRITRRLEDELDDRKVTNDALDFFSTLTLAYPEMEAVQQGLTLPAELRKASLLGSSTFLRVLAGVVRNLVDQGIDIEEVIKFLTSLRPLLRTPIDHGSPLLLTGCFQIGANAPSARMGDVAKLEVTLTEWALNPPPFLTDVTGDTDRRVSVSEDAGEDAG
jgi:hypothetical protein